MKEYILTIYIYIIYIYVENIIYSKSELVLISKTYVTDTFVYILYF